MRWQNFETAHFETAVLLALVLAVGFAFVTPFLDVAGALLFLVKL